MKNWLPFVCGSFSFAQATTPLQEETRLASKAIGRIMFQNMHTCNLETTSVLANNDKERLR